MMDPYTFKSSFPRDLTKSSTEQPKVCSPCIQSDSFAASFPPITTDFKLDYFGHCGQNDHQLPLHP